MVGVVIEPDYHRRVFGQLYEQVVEAAQSVSAEHIYLVGEGAEVVELVFASREDTVPEEGYLLFEGRLGGDEAVRPVGGIVSLHGVEVHVASEDEVIGNVVALGRTQEAFY